MSIPTFDVIVVGGGIVGVAAARELAQGLEVRSGLERARSELDAGRPEEAWEALGGVLKLEPRNGDARRLRREIAELVAPPKLERARELLARPDDVIDALDEALDA